MLALLVIAFLIGPCIAVLLLVAVATLAIEGYPQTKKRIEERKGTRLECMVCGAHTFTRVGDATASEPAGRIRRWPQD